MRCGFDVPDSVMRGVRDANPELRDLSDRELRETKALRVHMDGRKPARMTDVCFNEDPRAPLQAKPA